jgi:hypothetical protein
VSGRVGTEGETTGRESRRGEEETERETCYIFFRSYGIEIGLVVEVVFVGLM